MRRGWKIGALTLIATVALTGSAFAQRGGFGFGFGRGGGGASLLAMPEVQAELKMTDEQKTKATALAQQLREEQRGQFQQLQGLAPEEIQKKLAENRAHEDSLVSQILNADQQKRYHQLVLQ